MTLSLLVAVSLLSASPFAIAQDPHAQHQAAMDRRGNHAMGFDQGKARHTFATSERGGTIQVVAIDAKDQQTITQIRAHLREIARLFKAGDFSKPLFIHARNPPGTDTLKARRADIEYRYADVPSGGTVTLSSTAADAVAAIQAYLQFQQTEHAR